MTRLRRLRKQRRRRRRIRDGIRSKIFLIEADAAKYVELRILGFEDVRAEATAENVTQVKVLQGVFVKIGEAKRVKFPGQVEVVADSAMNCVRSGKRRRLIAVPCIHLCVIERELILRHDA